MLQEKKESSPKDVLKQASTCVTVSQQRKRKRNMNIGCSLEKMALRIYDIDFETRPCLLEEKWRLDL